MGFEYLYQVFVFVLVFFEVVQFIVVGVEGIVWSMFEGSDGGRGFLVDIDQVFSEGFYNFVVIGVDFVDMIWICFGCFNDIVGVGVDDCRYFIGLCIKCIFFSYLEFLEYWCLIFVI